MRFAVVQIIALVVPLLVAGTCIMGGVAWWNIAKYHLPVSKIAAFLATILPFVNYVAYKFLVSRSYQNAKGQQRINISPLTALASIILYSLNVVLITFSSTYLTEPTANCVLSERWRAYFRAKSLHIRDIQNALQCCGFRAYNDMPYPFPAKKISPNTCSETLGSKTNCMPLWSTEMKKNAGMLVGASGLIIFVNLVTLLVVLSNSRVLNRLLFFPFKGPRDYRQFMREDENNEQQQQERRRIEAYRDDDEEERGDEEQQQQQQRRDGSQSLENSNNDRRAITAQDDWEAAESQRLLDHSGSAPANRYN